MRRQAWILGLIMAAGFVFSAFSGSSARASEAADFYKGKTLTWMVSTGPGGGHDFYARLIVKHMAKIHAGHDDHREERARRRPYHRRQYGLSL